MRTQNIPTDNFIQNVSLEQPAIDARILEQLRMLLGAETPHVLAGLIENYLECVPELLQDLRHAVKRNRKRISPITRTLKSRSIAFGALKLCALCDELEGNESAEACKAKLAQIEAECERVKLTLEAEWRRLYERRLKTDVFFPTGSYKNIGFYPK
ncbi:MAG: Hpt domain-containing protein [Anaerolineae bacterium]|nr:Hpt domain-containing protein [Anaerolineae bacterium]